MSDICTGKWLPKDRFILDGAEKLGGLKATVLEYLKSTERGDLYAVHIDGEPDQVETYAYDWEMRTMDTEGK